MATKEKEDDNEFQIDPTGFDVMIRKAIAEVIAEKFLNGDIFVDFVENDKNNSKTEKKDKIKEVNNG